MTMQTVWMAVGASLGVALAQKFLTPVVPASVATVADGAVVTYGVPIVGAAAGLMIVAALKK